MISIICTNCQANLSIDDAFAGGVCRCQHCGTIQTVPSKRKGPGATAAGLGVKEPKALYQKRARESGVGTGLDELAEVVTSSGMTGSGLASRAARPGGAGGAAAAQSSSMLMFLGIAAIVIILLLVAILVILKGKGDGGGSLAGSGTPAQSGGTGSAGGGGPTTPAVEPTFAGVKLDHRSVIYVLDRGSSISEPFGSLKQATFKSIESLGTNRQFQIIFWDNAQDPGAFPPLLAFATEANIATARRQSDDIYAFGATDAKPALEKAMSQRPAAIVLVTGKGADLDDSFVQMVNDVKKDAPVVIHTFAVGGSGESTALKRIADSTGGQYRELTSGQLAKLGQ